MVDYNEMLKAKVLSSSLFFTRYFFKERFQRKFVVNHHHVAICEFVDRILSGDCKNLLVRMPPRYGKTEIIVKSLIAHGLALNPSSKFIHLSYSADLALDNSEDVRDFIQCDEYQRLFPHIKIDKSSSAKKKWYTEDGGGVYATATGGQITGFGAGQVEEEAGDDKGFNRSEFEDYEEYFKDFIDSQKENVFSGAIIIDDPTKPDDADSETKRERINERFETTIRSRTNSRNTPIVVVGQAVHERDLIGYLLETEPEKWELLTLPAIDVDEDGNEIPLWEFKHTLEELRRMRVVNEYVFESQYQQNPKPRAGRVFPSEDLNYFDINDLNQNPDGKIFVCDTADEGDDSLCGPMGYQYGDKIYIVDVLFTTDPVEITQPLVAAFIDKHEPDVIQFESNNGGKQYAKTVDGMTKHRKRCNWKPTTANKHTRILNKSGIIKETFYFLNEDQRSEQYSRYMRELCMYSKSGKNKHDDGADGTTMMAEATGREKWGW